MKKRKYIGQLQQAILIIALDGQKRGWKADVYPSDVKRFYYGFPVHRKQRNMFRVADIGFSRYRAAGVSIVKAFHALERKGLVEKIRCHGVSLTPKGVKAAQMVK